VEDQPPDDAGAKPATSTPAAGGPKATTSNPAIERLRAGEQDLDAALDAQLAEFNQQMDELLGRLDQVGRGVADASEDSPT
jgi:hypothetical protein